MFLSTIILTYLTLHIKTKKQKQVEIPLSSFGFKALQHLGDLKVTLIQFYLRMVRDVPWQQTFLTGCAPAAWPRCRSVKSALSTGLPVEKLYVSGAPCCRQLCELCVDLTARRKRKEVKGELRQTATS